MPTAESPQGILANTPAPTEEQLASAKKKIVEVLDDFVSRDGWLAQSGKFAEEAITVEGLGKVLIVELSGAARASIQAQQSRGLLSDVKSVDVAAYQRAVLLAGVADPTSPTDSRRPMFKQGDMDSVMGIGGGKIAKVVEAIEKLSGLDVGAVQRAEGNSDETPSDAGTS